MNIHGKDKCAVFAQIAEVFNFPVELPMSKQAVSGESGAAGNVENRVSHFPASFGRKLMSKNSKRKQSRKLDLRWQDTAYPVPVHCRKPRQDEAPSIVPSKSNAPSDTRFFLAPKQVPGS